MSTTARPRRTPAQDERAAERAHRIEMRKRSESRRRKQMAFYIFCLAALLGIYWYTNYFGGGSPVVLGAEIRAPDGSAFLADDVGSDLRTFGDSDRRKSERQRKLVSDLARRHVGTEPHRGSREDLVVLQDIIDGRFLATDQVYELQSLGVVLGDVMAEQLGLEWVVVSDEYGRSRALHYGALDDYFFPVTMISRRYEKNIPVDVAELYKETEREITALQKRGR